MDATCGKRLILTGVLLAGGIGTAGAQGVRNDPGVGLTARYSAVDPFQAPSATATPAPPPALPATRLAPAPATVAPPTPSPVPPTTTAPPTNAAAAAADAATAEPVNPFAAPASSAGVTASLAGPQPLGGGGNATFGDQRTGQSPVLLGDMLPLSITRAFPHAAAAPIGPPPPPNPGVPPGAPGPPGSAVNLRKVVRTIVPSVRGFKVSENQSPKPQDRIFGSFNFYGDVNGDVNRRAGGVISSMRVYRENFGFEKTFLDGNASIGMRFPLDTLSVNSGYRPIGGTNTAVGNLSIFGKYVLWQEDQGKHLLSTGMMITTPTGPSSFAGAPASYGFHDTLFQPFVGLFWAWDDFYVQGFTAVEVPTQSADVTMYYNDLSLGYFLYRNEDQNAFLRAFVPTFEVHINTPLNHRGALRAFDQAGTPDIVDLTYGANIYFGQRSVLSCGVATPTTGPRPFAYEFMALLNIYYGRTARAGGYAITPPVMQ